MLYIENVPVLEKPLTLEEITQLADDDLDITVIVKLTLWDILDAEKIYENFNELLEERVTDESPGIEDYSYEICGHEDNTILFKVNGSVESILNENNIEKVNRTKAADLLYSILERYDPSMSTAEASCMLDSIVTDIEKFLGVTTQELQANLEEEDDLNGQNDDSKKNKSTEREQLYRCGRHAREIHYHL